MLVPGILYEVCSVASFSTKADKKIITSCIYEIISGKGGM